MRYFLIAGEASGDLHASRLISALRKEDANPIFAGMGGEKMQAAGCELYQDYRSMAYMGLVAVLRHLPEVRDNFRIAREALRREQPDVLILIDYPSFNLRIAAWCKRHLPSTRIVYYIPPKIWAWKTWRVHRIGKLCDLVLGIFPFEPSFYQAYGYDCTYVGNPNVANIPFPNKGEKVHKGAREESIALLPGSRLSEITHCLPRMLEAALRFPNYQIEVAMAPGIDDTVYRNLSKTIPSGEEKRIRFSHDTYKLLAHARAAVVNSGTATLETALIGTPQVAVYHLACSRLIGWIRPLQRHIFHIPYFTLVNILAGEELIRELLAEDFTTTNIVAELRRLLSDEAYEKRMRSGYEHIRQSLGEQDAAAVAAQAINQMAANR